MALFSRKNHQGVFTDQHRGLGSKDVD
jgi:hypothetical protein